MFELGEDRTDLGMDDIGECYGEEDEFRFINLVEFNELKKEMQAHHKFSLGLKSMISDVSTQLSTLRNNLSPEGKFSFEIYENAWAAQQEENERIMENLKNEMINVHEILIEQNNDHKFDRKILYQEIQHSNRRIYVGKAELREDFGKFSKVLNQLDSKQT